MLERYFVKPSTIDRIRASWIGPMVERYVGWLAESGYAARCVYCRVPILISFGEFARDQGVTTREQLPSHVGRFVAWWLAQRPHRAGSGRAVENEIRGPVLQMLRIGLGEGVMGVSRKRPDPFSDVAPRFFEFLKCEKGLRPATLRLYRHALKLFRAYLDRIGVRELSALSPVVLSAYVAETCPRYVRSSVRNMCGMLKVFFRHLYVEGAMVIDLSAAIEAPKMYRLSNVPRSITWEEVGRMLASVDRRTAMGRRDYAVLLLLITYGLRAHEVARLTLDDIDWKRERLLVPERKAGHHTAYPLSTMVGQAILEYLQNGRPTTTTDRHVFFRVLAPPQPLTAEAISSRTSNYLRKAGIPVARPGSHTLRHTCVQRLIDAEFPLKIIGDYVGHSSPESTEIYTKVAIEALREVSLGAGEGII